MALWFNWNNIGKHSAICAPANNTPFAKDISPLASGLVLQRSTLRSNSTSHRSLMVQAVARVRMLPQMNTEYRCGSKASGWNALMPIKPGIITSYAPERLFYLPNLIYGFVFLKV
eukprot:Mrub_07884.p5 GENE.Mrub_07884~~Mrub_07884.p5  ORF type:complete len:115 (-),score=28.89 Mrub_07884:7-351(-)